VLQSKTFKRQFLTANYCQGAMVSWILSETHHDRQCIGFTLQILSHPGDDIQQPAF
jgi:hypothetical protein